MSDDLGVFFGAILLIFVTAVVTGVCANGCGMDAVRAEAVKAGVGEYVVINEHGRTEFRWVQYCTEGRP